jgi:hypothetical protein
MSDEKTVRRNIIPSDVDAQGNVTIWDHGPQLPEQKRGESDEDFKVRHDKAEADAEAWNKAHVPPLPVTMHAADAGQALLNDDDRYTIEPIDLDEAAVEAEVKKIQEARAAAAAAPQNAADRKVAIARLMGERRAEQSASKTKPDPVVEENHS